MLSSVALERQIVDTLNPFRYRGYFYDWETGYYYLQSRYYNPNWCRFLNADILIGLTDFAGYNLFAYCANNPVILIDLDGKSPLPFWELLYRAEIHYAVQNHILSNNEGFQKEIVLSGGIRIDLVDSEGGAYEVKPCTYLAGFRLLLAVDQLDNYIEVSAGKYHIGTKNISGKFSHRDFYVQYWSVGNGIIVYSFRKEKKKVQAEGEWVPSPVATTSLSLAMGGMMCGKNSSKVIELIRGGYFGGLPLKAYSML